MADDCGAINPSYNRSLPMRARLLDFLGKYTVVLNGVRGTCDENDRDNKHEIADFVVAVLMRDLESELYEHRKEVGRFLSEMYATMIDPVEDADPSLRVKGMCEILLKRAREDRELISNLAAPRGGEEL